jgi:Cu+-exporting ATPase
VSAHETIRFPVAGMTCASCVNRITRSVKKVEGVSKVRVDLGKETATVTRDPGLGPDAAIAAAIAAAGYAADLSAAEVVPASEPRGFFARLTGSTR